MEVTEAQTIIVSCLQEANLAESVIMKEECCVTFNWAQLPSKGTGNLSVPHWLGQLQS